MTSDEVRERYARQRTCTHPAITRDVVDEVWATATRYADSTVTYLTCPDCGYAGYAELDTNERPVLLDEPTGAGRDTGSW